MSLRTGQTVGDLYLSSEIDLQNKLDKVSETCTLDGNAIASIGRDNHNGGDYSFVIGQENTIFSENSFVAGSSNKAGLRCWYYQGIDFSNRKVYLTGNQPENKNNIVVQAPFPEIDVGFESNLSVGDKISFVNNSKYENSSTVTGVDHNVLTLDSIPFNTINAIPN